MKKCLSAVRYGLETLGVSSDKLFHLIETSRGYDGEDYDRWLAGRIIDVAEADGVGFSQLLVKKFNILMELAAQDGLMIRDVYLEKFCKELELGKDEIYTVGYKDYEYFSDEKKMDDFDFFSGVDLDSENSFFTDGLPEELQEKVKDGNLPFTLLLNMDTAPKKSELFSDAKNRCVSIKYYGSLLIYRMCLLMDVYGNSDTKFSFLCPVEFLYDEDNRDIFRELLSRFKVTGYAISDLNPYFGEYAYCVCKGRSTEEEEDFGIILKTLQITEVGEEKLSESEKLYTHTYKRMSEYLKNMYICEDKVPYEQKGVLSGWTVGRKKAIGYINLNHIVELSGFPIGENTGNCIPITKKNLLDCIAYYGLRASNEECGMSTDIPMFVSGHDKYSDLVYNCLPLFLFDINAEWKGYKVKQGDEDTIIKNRFDIDSPLVKQLLDMAEVHFSFEAKELMSFCKSYIQRYDRDRSLVTFNTIRKEIADDGLDKMYYNALVNLKKYISSTYRGVY